MGELGLNLIDRTVHDTNRWLKQISEELGHPDRQMAYHALRGVLHALRDRLTVDETADLGAQLPTLIRGIFYEGYKPAGKPERYRHLDEFLEKVNPDLQSAGGANPEAATRAVFTVIEANVSGGVVEHVRDMLPDEVRRLWPEHVS